LLNKRPLWIDEDLRVITPEHILKPATDQGFALDAKFSFARVLGQIRQAVAHFWERWMSQYTKILSYNRYARGSPFYLDLKAGDAVLVDLGKSIFHQQLQGAQVIETKKSRDGQARKIRVQLDDKKKIWVHIKKLYLPESQLLERRIQSKDIALPPVADVLSAQGGVLESGGVPAPI
jgi:hypothetical protein